MLSTPSARLLMLASLAVLAGCTASAHPPSALPPPKVTLAPAIKRQVVDYDEYTGHIEAVQSVEVRARVTGYLQEVKFKDGDMVRENDLLFLIDPSTYQALYNQAKAQIDLWQAKFDFAEATRARNAKLVTGGSVTKEEFESSVASRNEAAASLVAARADTEARKIDLDFCQVKSPIDGRIDRTYVTKGNLVQSGPGTPTLLTRIVSVNPIYVYFDVDELALLKYTENRRAEEGVVNRIPLRDKKIPIEISLADDSIYPHEGIVDFGSNQVDQGTGTLTARASVPNPEGTLTPGLFVRVRVTSARPYEAILVSEQAIGTNQTERFVYILDSQNTAHRQKVVLGAKQGNARVIKEGVQEGDRIVINGALLVRDDKPVDPTDGQMLEPPPVDTRLLRPGLPAGNGAVESPAAAGSTPATTTKPHEVRRPIER